MRRLAVPTPLLPHRAPARAGRFVPAGHRRRVGATIGVLALAALLGGRGAEAARGDGPGLGRAAAPVPGLTVTLSTDRATYTPGALHVLSASAVAAPAGGHRRRVRRHQGPRRGTSSPCWPREASPRASSPTWPG